MKLSAVSQFRSNAQPKEVTLFFINNAKYEADCYQPSDLMQSSRKSHYSLKTKPGMKLTAIINLI